MFPRLNIGTSDRSSACCFASGHGSKSHIEIATTSVSFVYHFYAALLRGGAGAHEALAWIEARREDGFRSRFTLPASRDVNAIREMCTIR